MQFYYLRLMMILVVLVLLLFGQFVPSINAILQGDPVPEKQFPFMVAIFNEKNLLCGGIVLTYKTVLTACRCLTVKGVKLEKANGTVYVGHVMVDELDQKFAYEIEKTTCHSSYNEQTHENDIGIIQVKSQFESIRSPQSATHIVRQACLPLTPIQYQPDKCIVLGWGMTDQGTQAIQLQRANISVNSNSECAKYRPHDFKPETMMCAGGKATPQKVSNFGDSGGPLACISVSKKKDKFYTIVGVTFQGQDANSDDEYVPAYFTQIEPFAKWLKKQV